MTPTRSATKHDSKYLMPRHPNHPFAMPSACASHARSPAPLRSRRRTQAELHLHHRRRPPLGCHGRRPERAWAKRRATRGSKSPNMDRLAADGVRFRNAFITLSICSPGRAGFLTGQYTHVNGVMDNGTPFPENSVTHATLLRDAGYQTAYFGKWHMGNQRGQRPGFQHSASFIGQGSYHGLPVRNQRRHDPHQRLGRRCHHRLRHRLAQAKPRPSPSPWSSASKARTTSAAA